MALATKKRSVRRWGDTGNEEHRIAKGFGESLLELVMEREAAPLPVRGLLSRGLLASDVWSSLLILPTSMTRSSQVTSSLIQCLLWLLMPMPKASPTSSPCH